MRLSCFFFQAFVIYSLYYGNPSGMVSDSGKGWENVVSLHQLRALVL